MINSKRLKNNKSLALNVSLLKNILLNGKALVLSRPMEGLKENAFDTPFMVNDFFSVVIAENEEALASLPFADFLIYADSSPYKDSVMHIEKMCMYKESILCTNYRAIEKLKKLNRNISTCNVNYLPTNEAIQADPHFVEGVSCGLNSVSPGVHLAKILGCSDVRYNPEDLESFITEKERIVPVNLLQPRRRPLIQTLF